jgi:hypothetical protein
MNALVTFKVDAMIPLVALIELAERALMDALVTFKVDAMIPLVALIELADTLFTDNEFTVIEFVPIFVELGPTMICELGSRVWNPVLLIC